ncbi:MAG: flagellar hook-length control protein FliK [Candidatus Rokubacteria bacterium]|nr:flagellar hook-length control protein FliK [Candidatus Rokubacteria bacterium]
MSGAGIAEGAGTRARTAPLNDAGSGAGATPLNDAGSRAGATPASEGGAPDFLALLLPMVGIGGGTPQPEADTDARPGDAPPLPLEDQTDAPRAPMSAADATAALIAALAMFEGTTPLPVTTAPSAAATPGSVDGAAARAVAALRGAAPRALPTSGGAGEILSPDGSGASTGTAPALRGAAADGEKFALPTTAAPGTPTPAATPANAQPESATDQAGAGTGVAQAREPVPSNGVAPAREPVPRNSVAPAREPVPFNGAAPAREPVPGNGAAGRRPVPSTGVAQALEPAPSNAESSNLGGRADAGTPAAAFREPAPFNDVRAQRGEPRLAGPSITSLSAALDMRGDLPRVSTPAAVTAAGTPVAPGEPHDVIPQVVRAARVVVAAGGGEMHVDLEPPSLGGVRVSASARGESVELTLHAERPETRSLLVQELPAIQQALADRGVGATAVTVAPTAPSPSTLTLSPRHDGRAPDRRPATPRERERQPASDRRHRPFRAGRVSVLDITV